MRSVTVAEAVERQLCTAARRCLPDEMVAALAGHRDGAHRTVLACVELTNAAATAKGSATDRFRVDGVELARAEHALRTRGLRLLGFAHSHPHGQPALSATDRRELWRGCLQIVVATDGARCRWRAFELAGDGAAATVHELKGVAEAGR